MMQARWPRSVFVFALLLALLTTLPYVLGALNTGDNLYTGAPHSPLGAQMDYYSHLAKMWQGWRGGLSYRLLFTHEAHAALFPVQTFYVLLGWVGRILPLSLPMVYHLARFFGTLGAVLAIWRVTGIFFTRAGERWIALLFATLAGGWSWLLLIFAPQLTAQTSPIEFWLTDAFTLLGALYMPHFAAAVALQALSIVYFHQFITDLYHGWRGLVGLTLTLVALSSIQPYGFVLLVPVFGLVTLYLWRARLLTQAQALWLALPFGLYTALCLYQYWIISHSAVWADFAAQNTTLSPNVWYYLTGYLPFIIPMVVGWRALNYSLKSEWRWLLPVFWLVSAFFLLYAPFPTQRRYLLGLQTPLALLAGYGWVHGFLPRLSRPRRPLVTGIYILFAGLALLGLWFGQISAGLAGATSESNAYATPDEAAAYAWLRAQGRPDALVLTTMQADGTGSGGRLVGMTGQRVFIGHWYETADFAAKSQQVAQFYAPSTRDADRQAFLREIGAVYVWYDAAARSIGTWNPAQAAYLQPVFTSTAVTVYQVVGL